ncbi:MAG: biopolymer transporter ExbD [Nannocystaceae bacterium]|nr:biopolymer transporter ExbD [Nannocystaceae bacterium]
MAGGDFDDEAEITAINVTPLVDVMLVLLIIFMVTTTVITNPEGVRVTKPEASSGEQLERESILLVCHQDGSILVDGERVSGGDAAIRDRITDKLARDKNLQGIVQCDTSAEVGSMVHLIDLLRTSGVKKYAIATKKPDAPSGG